MYNIDNELLMAIRNARIDRTVEPWSGGNRVLLANDKNTFSVAYRGNVVFNYNRKTKKFWINDCGWNTRTTKNIINTCFKATEIPYSVFSSKDRFCIRSFKDNFEKIIGDGKVTKAEIEKPEYWVKKVK